MRGRYLIFATLAAFMILAAVLAVGFSSMSDLGKGERLQTKIERYGRQILAKANEFVSPVLGTFGISLDGSTATDEVSRHLEEAAAAVDDAMKKISQ